MSPAGREWVPLFWEDLNEGTSQLTSQEKDSW